MNYAKLLEELGQAAKALIELRREQPHLFPDEHVLRTLEKRYDEIAERCENWST